MTTILLVLAAWSAVGVVVYRYRYLISPWLADRGVFELICGPLVWLGLFVIWFGDP